MEKSCQACVIMAMVVLLFLLLENSNINEIDQKQKHWSK